MFRKRTREDGSTNRWGGVDCWPLIVSANKWLPSLPRLGFTFWFSWNLIAFSGSVWCGEQKSTLLVSYLFIAHLIASAVTHLFFAKRYHQLGIVATRSFLATGATIGSIGSLLMVLVGQDLVSSLVVFFLGGALAGMGTTFMLIRSSVLFAQLSPRKSFLNISICAIGAIFLYYYVEGYESILGSVMFVLLPVFSGLFLSVKINTASELEMMRTVSPLPSRFRNLIISVFVYSLCQEVTKGYLLTNLSMSQSVLCMQYVMLVLMVLFCAFVAVALSFPSDFSFGKIFYPLAIFLIAPQVGAIFLMDSFPLFTAVGIDFAGYGFDVFIWVMCAYLAFQTKANCIKIIGYITASLSFGLAIGSAVSLVLLDLSLTSFELSLINFVLAVLCIIVTVIVFPEKKLLDLFRPVDDDGEEDDLAVRIQKAIWRQACERAADAGGLSAREREVLFLISKGLSAQQIADEFTISIHTARTHIRNIHSKLNVSNRTEIVGLIESYKNTPGTQERS